MKAIPVVLCALLIGLPAFFIYDGCSGAAEYKWATVNGKSFTPARDELVVTFITVNDTRVPVVETVHHPARYYIHTMDGEVVEVDVARWGMYSEHDEVHIGRKIGKITGIKYSWSIKQ